MNPHARSHFLTLHLWIEELDPPRCEWRGRVRHVPSGDLCYFRDWATLVAFLERVTAPVSDPPDVGGPESPTDSP